MNINLLKAAIYEIIKQNGNKLSEYDVMLSEKMVP